MRRLLLSVLAAVALVLPLATPATAEPVDDAVKTFTHTKNMHPMGFTARPVPPAGTGSGRFNSDLAFWGHTAYQGNYNGFRIIDVSEPDNPVQLNDFEDCRGDQGDVLVWNHLLIRSWNSPAPAGATCDGQPVAQGFEGLHIFDVSNPRDPNLIGSVRMAADTTPAGCGSHTATLVPDVARGNLYAYSSGSSANCPGIDIVKIPLSNPAGASFLHRVPSGRSCHDTGVILGSANLVACAGGNGFTVFSIDPKLDPSAPGSIENPTQLYSKSVPGVTVGHSAAFTWDGQVLVFGHEPGGGSQARCQATSSVTDRTIFFFAARTGEQLGSFIHARPQTSTENCTWHNYNVVPTDQRHILVAAGYQSGISVLDFADPTHAREVAFADPAPLVHPTDPNAIVLGGDWSTYWYDGRIYESDITRGLIIWNLSDPAVAGARKLTRSNPQAQETSFPFKGA